jgi:AraC family transcriptional regulator of adaptative response/methylated-DNA-[protein]-cysteine methyltransferase
MQRAYLARDASYDGVFFLAVRTTGIFCRPSCPARKPRPQNVEYYPTAGAALHAGYRPCRRCRPLETDGRPPGWVRKVLAAIDQSPEQRLRDEDLHTLGVDPARVRRYFKQHYGMTFQAYHRAQRLGGALHAVQKGSDLMMTAYEHGFQSSSGFRTAFERAFGGPPGRRRDATCAVAGLLESPLGPLLAATTARAVCYLSFADERDMQSLAGYMQRRLGVSVVPGSNQILQRLRAELGEYFAGRRREFTVPVETRGTDFQMAVWAGLQRIPYGQTVSYAELAQQVHRPAAQRAVGQANHNNPVAIVIPCHRVVNASGALGGYGGGLWRKQWLLDLERRPSPADAQRPTAAVPEHVIR